MWLSRVHRGTGICCARQPIRQAMNLASLILVFGFVGAIAAGCSSPVPSLGANAYQPRPNAGGAYASGSCFYSNDFGAERTSAGHVLHWCGPEPRAVN